MIGYVLIKVIKGVPRINACHFIDNDCGKGGLDIYNECAHIKSDNSCKFTSEIHTQTKISILNNSGTFNGCGVNVFKKF